MRSGYIKRIKTQVKDNELIIQKRLGQNFLVDREVMTQMVEAANLNKDDKVLEIGPGLGFLTESIREKSKKIIAIEKDKNLYQVLKRKYNKNIKLINGDVFTVNLDKHRLTDLNYKIVSNIPYYLTSRLIRYFTENEIRPSVMVILVQEEVADRVVASAGQHSLLSLSVQFYGQPEKIITVDSRSFFPAPEINSAVLKISLFKKPLFDDVDIKLFFQMLKMAFSSRRKQLHNNISSGLKVESKIIKQILKNINLDSTIRAQSLNLDQWHDLYLDLQNKKLLN